VLNSDYKNVYDLVKKQNTQVDVYFNKYSNVVKNDHGDVIGSDNTSVKFYAFPIEYNPSDKKRDQIGIKTPVDVLAYLTFYEMEKKGYTFDDFQTENMSVTIFGRRYHVKQAKEFSHNSNGFLYNVLAGISDGKK